MDDVFHKVIWTRILPDKSVFIKKFIEVLPCNSQKGYALFRLNLLMYVNMIWNVKQALVYFLHHIFSLWPES